MTGLSLRDQINLEIEIKQKELAELITERDQIDYDLFVLRTGIKFGSIVKNRKGLVFRVTKVEVVGCNIPFVYGNPRLKDGAFGTTVRYICGVEKIEE